jgi:hypothetical protein
VLVGTRFGVHLLSEQKKAAAKEKTDGRGADEPDRDEIKQDADRKPC